MADGATTEVSALSLDWDVPRNPPAASRMGTASSVESGPRLSPVTYIATYSSEEWEAFIEEWVTFLPSGYVSVQRYTGAGDKGVDVAAFHDKDRLRGCWDNYQCKHYARPLSKADAFIEIGKCLWYAFRKDFCIPKRYVFVAPRGASTALGLLLANELKLRQELEKAWEKSVSGKITSSGRIELTGDFKAFIDGVDFRIFEFAPLLEIIESHRKTPYFVGRFGGGLPSVLQ